KMSVCKNYYEANLFNIEEVLSILEMQNSLEGREENKEFAEFILDVIRFYTPPILLPKREKLPGNWYDSLFADKRIGHHLKFVASLFRLDFAKLHNKPFSFMPAKAPTTDYSVITLNYDCVLEAIQDALSQSYQTDHQIEFRQQSSHESHPNLTSVELAKL